jgi:hypothetical protein
MRRDSRRKERKTRRNNIIIGSVLLFTMVFSMLAIYVSSPDSSSDLTYNGHTFKVVDSNGNQMVTTSVNGKDYSFYTMPSDAIRLMANITGVQEMASAQKIIFVKEPLGLNNQASSAQRYLDVTVFDLQTLSGKTILSGVSEKDDLSDKRVYSCNDSSVSSPVVLMKDGVYSAMNITQVGAHCYELRSDGMNILVLRDYLLYKSSGIIQ